MVKKTRDRFVEVARQLFARNGVANTTMNDIASASDKGRRTIYTYFKSKREIFNAVIESETDQLLESLKAVICQPLPPEEKLKRYIGCRLQMMREIVSRNGTLKAGFFRDIRKVDRAKSIIIEKETKILADILREGVEMGVFRIVNVREWSIILANSIQGLDVPYIREGFAGYGIDDDKIVRMVSDLILNGILVKDNK